MSSGINSKININIIRHKSFLVSSVVMSFFLFYQNHFHHLLSCFSLPFAFSSALFFRTILYAVLLLRILDSKSNNIHRIGRIYRNLKKVLSIINFVILKQLMRNTHICEFHLIRSRCYFTVHSACF